MKTTTQNLILYTVLTFSLVGCGKLNYSADDLGAEPVSFLSFDRVLVEMDEGSGAVLSVSLSVPRAIDTKVTVALSSFRDDEADDFDETTTTIVIPAGLTEVSVSISNYDDNIFEGDEDFDLSLKTDDEQVAYDPDPILIFVTDND